MLLDPHETPDIELKGWLDIVGNNDHKAVLAKSLMALANHGGGFVRPRRPPSQGWKTFASWPTHISEACTIQYVRILFSARTDANRRRVLVRRAASRGAGAGLYLASSDRHNLSFFRSILLTWLLP
jgi:hypothetical protein